jgi:hypothetical protein
MVDVEASGAQLLCEAGEGEVVPVNVRTVEVEI